MRTQFVLVVILLIQFSCTKESEAKPQKLNAIFREAARNENLLCLVVYKDDQIVKEAYFNHTDENTPHDVRSVTKSVMATLTGIAIDRGLIPSEQEAIGNYLKPYYPSIDSVKSAIKISDVLTMSTGIEGPEIQHEYLSWYNAPNQMEYTLTKPMDSQPGEHFNYNSGAVHLLSAIIEQAGGTSVKEFAQAHLFGELDIDLDQRYWQTDKQGLTNGAAGLQLTPYDMLKLGQLYLNKGMYNGKRIVSESWIEKTTTPYIATGRDQCCGPEYGYLWWIGESHGQPYYFANGYGGQFLVVVPGLSLIAVATNKWLLVASDTANTQWYSTLELIIDQIISLYTES